MKKVSGSKSVFVKINNVGRNYLPFVEDLRDRRVKYIDVVPVDCIPYSADAGFSSMAGFLTLAGKQGNDYPYYNIPLVKFDITSNLGQRLPIFRVLNLSSSYIDISNSSDIGTVVCLVFWYDLPSYSSRNVTDNVAIDGFGVKIASNTYKNIFPDMRTLAGKRFRSISFCAPAKTPAGETGISLTDLSKIYVSFYKGNVAVLDLLPLRELYDIKNIEMLELSNILFDMTNSFAIVGGNGTKTITGTELYLNVAYESK